MNVRVCFCVFLCVCLSVSMDSVEYNVKKNKMCLYNKRKMPDLVNWGACVFYFGYLFVCWFDSQFMMPVKLKGVCACRKKNH